MKDGNGRKRGSRERSLGPSHSRAETLTEGGPGSWVKVLTQAITIHPKNPVGQLAYLLDQVYMPAHTGRKREVAEATRTRFGEVMRMMLRAVKALNMPIQRLDQLGRSHVRKIVAHWTHEHGLKPGTVANRLSNMRKFFVLVGKAEVLPKGETLYELLESTGVTKLHLKREMVAMWSKGWRAQGLEPLDVIKKIETEYPHEALLLSLMYAWGLRVNEALQLRPHDSDESDGLLVNRGTKGGRPRKTPYMRDPAKAKYQRVVLDRCRKWVEVAKTRDMGYPKATIKQARRKLYYVMERLNITRAGNGIVCHGLRHDFAADMFFDLTAHRPPAEGQETPQWFMENREAVKYAYRRVSEALGHWRPEISKAYLGSTTKMAKAQLERLKNSIRQVEMAPELGKNLQEAGVKQMWIVGTAAHGRQLNAGEAMHLLGSFACGGQSWGQWQKASEALQVAMGGKAVLLPLFEGSPPQEAVEVFLDGEPQVTAGQEQMASSTMKT